MIGTRNGPEMIDKENYKGLFEIDEIIEELEQAFQTLRYYSVEDFAGLIKRMYHKQYKEKVEKFA